MRRFVTALVLAGCSSPPAPPIEKPTAVVVLDAGAGASFVAPPVRTPRAPTKWVAGEGFQDIGAGRRGAVIRGRRLVLDGSITTVVDDKPIADLGRPRKIPEALGGGWVFIGTISLAFGKTFDGALVSIPASLDGAQIGFGIDRVLVKETTYELSTGKSVPSPVSNMVQLFGLPSGHVAARTKSGDVHLSVAKGKPFTKVASGVEMIAYDGKGFVLQSRTAQLRLGLDGKVGPLAQGPGLTTSDNVMCLGELPDMSRPPPEPPDIDRMIAPLTIAMDDGHVLTVAARDLVVFDGERGAKASTQKEVFANHESCFPLRGGTPAFVGCNDPSGMSLFRVEAVDRAPVLERSFAGVVTSDFGFPAPSSTLALGHRCDGQAALGAFCVRRDENTWTDIAVNDPQKLGASAPFLAGVVASKEGVPYGFAWQNGNGALIMIDGNSRSVRLIAKSDIPAWAQNAIRWHAVSASDGHVRFLLEGNRPGVMTIDSEGRVEAKPLTGRLSAIGARGLLVSPEGNLTETVDAGKTWQDLDPPAGGADPSSVQCHEGGCTVGPWHRLGWGR